MAKLQFKESFTMALVALRSNKLRTFLTLLGIIIGVLTIIAVVSVIQGLNNYVYTKMAFYGANDFSVQKFSMMGTSLKDFREQLKRKDLTLAERDLIRANCPSCELVGASASQSATVKYGSQSLKDTQVLGVTHIDHEIGAVVELTSGRHLQSQDESNARTVGVIGSDVAEKVFGGLDPLGRWLKVGSRNFQVIGVAKAKGKILGFSQDNFIRVPITTFNKVYGSRRSISINIHTGSQEQMAQAQEEVRTVLRSWRKRGYKDPDDFSFATSETFIQFYKTATSGIYFAMLAVSSIALIVGGIVIMNIMFVSVSERRKEIGIRMAVGARRRDILFQFLIESAVISGLGGFIGIVLGFLVARIISAATSMPSSVEPVSVVLAMVMSWSIGLFFGIYPANRAAKLDPVEALRAELSRLQIFREVFRMAIDSIRSHKLRSFLTILGIVIGVMTVIGMVSIIQGLNKSFLSELQSVGSDMIHIQKYDAVQMGERSEEERMRKDLSFEDAQAIEQGAPLVRAVAVSNYVSVFAQNEIKYQSAKSDTAMILGMNEKWPTVMSLYLPRLGRFVTEAEVDRSARVCVLGSELADALFPMTNPLGKEIRVGPEAFTVVGVLAKRGQMFGQSRDNFVGLPITTLMKYFPYEKDGLEIIAVPRRSEDLPETIDQIRNVLRQRRKVPYGKPDDFAVMTQDSMVDLYNQLTGAAYLVMIVISSIGLLVGGIGVMNIMLVSVKERTREIGIRKAIGARSGDILKQFLIEAVFLTGVGGLLGVLVGFGIALVVNATTPLPATVSPWSVVLGLSVSAAIGLFFGIFPAQKAAHMDPIESLRYE